MEGVLYVPHVCSMPLLHHLALKMSPSKNHINNSLRNLKTKEHLNKSCGHSLSAMPAFNFSVCFAGAVDQGMV